jgi:hypothetical protein
MLPLKTKSEILSPKKGQRNQPSTRPASNVDPRETGSRTESDLIEKQGYLCLTGLLELPDPFTRF